MLGEVWRRIGFGRSGLLILAACLMGVAPSGWAADRDDEEKKEGQEDPEGLMKTVELIQELMIRAEERLARMKTGRGTQEEQEKIIEELKKLIEEASEG